MFVSRYAKFSFVCVGIILFCIQSMSAHDRNYFYTKGTAGFSSYIGELNSINTGDPFFSYAFRGGIGYVLNRHLAFGADFRYADYPRLNQPQLDGDTRIRTSNIYVKYTFLPARSISLYALGGGGVTFYPSTDDNRNYQSVFGPVAGLGMDIRLTDQITIFVEGTMDFILDDEAIDSRKGDAGFDGLGFFGVGLRLNLRSTFKPISRVRIAAPDTVTALNPVNMEVLYEGSPAGPVSVQWHFGDGNTALGRSASTVYRNTGMFSVIVNVSDRSGRREARKDIVVVEPPVSAQINDLRVDGVLHVVNEPVTFQAEVVGSEPVIYNWDFGDGSTSASKSPRHTYESEGTFTVTLHVDNSDVAGRSGVDSRSIIIDVHDPTPIEIEEPVIVEFEPEQVELHTIYFGMGSIQLDDEARQLLRENIDTLQQYPDYCVQIDVFTDSVGNPQTNLRLSEQRARAVERFYVAGGIEPRRINRTGLGQITEPCPPGDPGPGCREHRRAESILMRCREN
jgi:outer membrane protein OmpA-like peptidoglycan-associated protein